MVLTVAALRTELLFSPRPRAALGVGARAAARLAETLDRRKPSGVLVVGFSGATRANLRPGTLVLASGVQGEGEEVRVPDGLLSRARRAVPEAGAGQIATVNGPASPEDKAWLSLDALAVDMESLHLARELSQRGIPFLIVRCVLDHLWEDVTFGLKVRWARRALHCARRLGKAARALAPVLEGGGQGDT